MFIVHSWPAFCHAANKRRLIDWIRLIQNLISRSETCQLLTPYDVFRRRRSVAWRRRAVLIAVYWAGLHRISTEAPSLLAVQIQHRIRQTSSAECHKDPWSDTISTLQSTQRTYCSLFSQTTYVHIFTPATRRLTASCYPTGTAYQQTSLCTDEVATRRCGRGPIHYSALFSTQLKPRSSGARQVDDKIKYHRPHRELARVYAKRVVQPKCRVQDWKMQSPK